MEYYNSHFDKTSKEAENYTKTINCAFRYLGFRDIRDLINQYARGKKALDFGCGTGISSYFLSTLNLNVTGVDVSKEMINQAKSHFPEIQFKFLEKEKQVLKENYYDIIFSSFVLFELSSKEKIVEYLTEAKKLLNNKGIIIILTGSNNMYSGEWLVLDTQFSDNNSLSPGKKVKVRVPELNTIFTDYYWPESCYLECFKKTSFKTQKIHYPLGKKEEPFKWKSEITSSPYVIYVLSK